MAFVPVIRPYLGGSSGPYLGGSKRTSREPAVIRTVAGRTLRATGGTPARLHSRERPAHRFFNPRARVRVPRLVRGRRQTTQGTAREAKDEGSSNRRKQAEMASASSALPRRIIKVSPASRTSTKYSGETSPLDGPGRGASRDPIPGAEPPRAPSPRQKRTRHGSARVVCGSRALVRRFSAHDPA